MPNIAAQKCKIPLQSPLFSRFQPQNRPLESAKTQYFYRSDQGAGLRAFLFALRDAALRHNVTGSPLSPVTRGTPRRNYMLPEFSERPDFGDPGHGNAPVGRMLLLTTDRDARSGAR